MNKRTIGVRAAIGLMALCVAGLLLAPAERRANTPPPTGQRQEHNCRMYAVLSDDLPADLLFAHLFELPSSLRELSVWNEDGWGIADYPLCGDEVHIARGHLPAHGDPAYQITVTELNELEPYITLGHVRNATAGAPDIPDPHPFHRVKNEKDWAFAHNGTIHDMDGLEELIGTDYLEENPLVYDPRIDSELYFLLVLKHIEENGWNVVAGIVDAVDAIQQEEETGGLNFILTDGTRIWAFRRGELAAHTLCYHRNAVSQYVAVASEDPSGDDNWTHLANYELAVIRRDAPVHVIDVQDYEPPAPGSRHDDAILLPYDGQETDYFGISVGVSGDKAVVGSYGDDDDGNWSGAAYVFAFNDLNCSRQQKLRAFDGPSDRLLGFAVDIDGDTVVAGAYGDDANGIDAGAAYVFGFDGVNWVEQAQLRPDDGAPGDHFGYSVAIHGDVVVVGAPQADAAGRAYVFRWNGEAWDEGPELLGDEVDPESDFGRSVAVYEDRILVGTPGGDLQPGAAYVFRYNAEIDDWVREARLVIEDGVPGDAFGYSVATSNGWAVVGAYHDDNENGVDAGSAYIYAFQQEQWQQMERVLADDGAPADEFGNSVAVCGQTLTFVIGASRAAENGDDAGAAYVFRYSDGLERRAKLLAGDGVASDRLGFSLALDYPTIVAGALGNDDLGDCSGSAYVFEICTQDNDCNDSDACTCDRCIDGSCRNTRRPYGDVLCNGVPNVFDLFCQLDLIEHGGTSDIPDCNLANADVEPCAGNGVVGVLDLLAVLAAIAGTDPCCGTNVCCIGIECSLAARADCEAADGTFMPGERSCDPNPCEEPVPGGAPSPDRADRSMPYSAAPAQINLVPSTRAARPGDTVDAHVAPTTLRITAPSESP